MYDLVKRREAVMIKWRLTENKEGRRRRCKAKLMVIGFEEENEDMVMKE